MRVEVWTLEPKGNAQKHRIELPSLEVICYKLGGKELLPFRSDEKGPSLYTYVSSDNGRQIVVTSEKFIPDDEFWENYADGQTLVSPVPVIPAIVPYDELKSILRENESGLMEQVLRLQSKRSSETRRFFVERRRFQRERESARYDGLCKQVFAQREYTDPEHRADHVKKAAAYSEKGAYSAAIYMDLRWFKRINDVMGHAFGDVVLSEVSSAIKKAVRDDDNIYRTGGEEFVAVVHNHKSEQDVRELTERIKEQVGSLRIPNPHYMPDALRKNGSRVFEKDDEAIKVCLSAGYSLFPTRTPQSLRDWKNEDYSKAFDEVAKMADKRMYADKNKTGAPSGDTLKHVQEVFRLEEGKKIA